MKVDEFEKRYPREAGLLDLMTEYTANKDSKEISCKAFWKM
jgi:hypothetical protein